MLYDKTLRSCERGPIKIFDGSTGLFHLDFISMLRIIDLRSGDKYGDSDGTLFQSSGKTLSVWRIISA